MRKVVTWIQGGDCGPSGHVISTFIWGAMCTEPFCPSLLWGSVGPWGAAGGLATDPALPRGWQGSVCTGHTGAVCVCVCWALHGSLPSQQGAGPSRLPRPLRTLADPRCRSPLQPRSSQLCCTRCCTPCRGTPSHGTAAPAGPVGGPGPPAPLPSRGLPYEVSAARRPRPRPRPPARPRPQGAAGRAPPRGRPAPAFISFLPSFRAFLASLAPRSPAGSPARPAAGRAATHPPRAPSAGPRQPTAAV